MHVCENCFDSDLISDYIIQNGEEQIISFICSDCGNSSNYMLDKFEFRIILQKIIRIHFVHEYTHGLCASAQMMAKDEDDDISVFLPSRILYSLRDISYELFRIDYEPRFYDLLVDSTRDEDSEFNCEIDDEYWINMGRDWDGSSRIELKWSEFCENVKHKARYFDHKQYNRIDELSKLNQTFQTLSKRVTTTLYRARKANEEEKLSLIESNPKEELGIAGPNKAAHNRFSPSGIPYVYLSADDETILKEIRVILGDRVAIGEFSISNLNLVDLRMENVEIIRKNVFLDSCTPQLFCSAKTILGFLADITKEVKKEDNHLEYIPTQIVSEYIWSLGYDGFIFDSSLCQGTNYVLFKDTYDFVDYRIIEITEDYMNYLKILTKNP